MMDGGCTSGPGHNTTGHQNIFNTFKYFCLSSKVQWCINYLLWTYFNIFNSSYYSGHILRFIPIKMSGELRCLARGDAVTSWLVELDKIFITITIWAGLGWAGLGGGVTIGAPEVSTNTDQDQNRVQPPVTHLHTGHLLLWYPASDIIKI